MAAWKNGEKRAFVRAELVTRVRVQPVTRGEFEQHKALNTGDLVGGTSSDSAGVGPLGGYIAQRLDAIEEKLDRILSRLEPGSVPSKDGVCYGTAQDVSGAGVKLVLQEAFPLGQFVLVSLSVPGFSIGFLEAYGEIVRVNPIGSPPESRFETSIKFLDISEDEREKLIAYAFRRQRQTIRDAAMDKEQTEELSHHGK